MRVSLLAILAISFFTFSHVEAQIVRFANQTEIGVLAGNGQSANFSARTFNGIRFKNVPIETGIAVGVDAYSQFTIVPVSISWRWNPLETKAVSPYLGFDIGHGFDWLQPKIEGLSYSGGAMLSPSAGIRVKTNRSSKVVMNLSYKRQEASTDSNFQFVDTPRFKSYETTEYVFKRLYISLGLSF